ncbi:MAG: cytochrome-c peroxidase [Desulfurivibrio sp.]|nr:cytochrome-c peroxidase [Desulfurivibrio sp.]MBU3937800.1 cytochrome-c peroxidase [Pseudomonadota bacterium]MBU4117289.1 cytochrome-c peroxidase [Pseudomonadota bacterium]
MLRSKAMLPVLLLVVSVLLPGMLFAGKLEPIKPVAAPRFNPMSAEKVELGKMIFFDRRLSGDGTMSCATCHIPEMAFTDGEAISLNYPTTRNWRNAPTLINLAYNRYLFHDGRAESMEDQALFPILSAFEMNQNLDFLEEELRSEPEYRKEFQKVFGTDDTTRERIALAIAAFERILVSQNAPLDRFLEGDHTALSEPAQKGLAIFTGKGKCTDCHYGMNLIDDKFHALNVPEHPEFQKDPRVAATRRFVAKFYNYEAFRTLQEDPGRYLITKKDEDWRAFKTPTLREIARTGPYMHNGFFETLDQVIDFFDQGGGSGTTALKPLGLSREEKQYLKAFLLEGLAGEPIAFQFPRIP